MSYALEEVVLSGMDKQLARQLAARIQRASEWAVQTCAEVGPTGQSRQDIGRLRRLFFFGRIDQDLYPLAGRVSINREFEIIGVHDELVTIDLLQVGPFFLHLSRVNDDGCFSTGLSEAMKQFVQQAETGHPLYPDSSRPLVLVLYYVLDEDGETVKRVGVGVASGDFTRIELAVIPNLLAFSTEVDEPVERDGSPQFGLRLKGGNESGDTSSTDEAPDEGPDESQN